jgi:hypothetical protein
MSAASGAVCPVGLWATVHVVNTSTGPGRRIGRPPRWWPAGTPAAGALEGHNLYDVAKIYKFGWPYISEAERLKISQQIDSMIEWSLANTLESDGTFAHDPTFSDSLADEYYFGVAFFDVVGHWRPENRFWTEAPVDVDAPAMCCRLKHRVKVLGLEGWAAEGAMGKLESNCGQC